MTTKSHVVVIQSQVALTGDLAQCVEFAKKNAAGSPLVMTARSYAEQANRKAGSTPVVAGVKEHASVQVSQAPLVATAQVDPTQLQAALEILRRAGYAKWSDIVRKGLADEPLTVKQIGWAIAKARSVQNERAWGGLFAVITNGGHLVCKGKFDDMEQALSQSGAGHKLVRYYE